MRWIDSCDCPFCGNDMWECEHLVLDLGGGGEDGGVGLRAWGGLETQAEMVSALLDLISFAWGEQDAPPTDEDAVLARLASVSRRLPFGSEDWWSGRFRLMENLAEDVSADTHGAESKSVFMGWQGAADGTVESGSALEKLWIGVVERSLDDVPDITLGDCDIMSMTAGLYYLVWAEDRARAESDIAAAVSAIASQIREAVGAAALLRRDEQGSA